MEGYIKFGTVFIKDSPRISELEERGFTTKRIQYSETEQIHSLMDEDALYLAEKLGILTVLSEDMTKSLQNPELWDIFVKKNRNFGIKFRVYCHFKDLGYIVKTGIHYGLDYSIYRTLPVYCHSEFCVLVADATQNSLICKSNQSDDSNGILQWNHVSSLTRLTPDVMKIFLICYVLPSENLPINIVTSAGDDSGSIDSLNLKLTFQNDHGSLSKSHGTNFKDFLKNHQVRCVASMVRRLIAHSDENFTSIVDLQNKYRSCSILKRPRQKQTSKKSSKKRHDEKDFSREKKSRHELMWNSLLET